jgi:endonuclease/exonuclease/phosphatase family metal-dependent hydrolase
LRDRGEDVGFRHIYPSFLLALQAETFIQEKTAMNMKKTMKLMSWNVGKPSKDTLLAHYPRIKDENVDILALQEVAPDTIEHVKDGLSKIGLDYIETSCDLAVDLDRQTGPHKNGKVTDGVLIASRWPSKLMPKFFEQIPWGKSALSAVLDSDYGEIEIHTIHVPNASSSGRWKEENGNWTYEKKGTSATKQRGRQIKVDTFKGVYASLSKPTVSNRHRILCGDFNSPKKEEHRNGNISAVIYFGDNYEQRRSEEQVLGGLAEYDLADSYLNETFGYSFVYNNGTRRRLDHIFSSSSLNPKPLLSCAWGLEPLASSACTSFCVADFQNSPSHNRPHSPA